MSNLAQFLGLSRAPISIVNRFSAGSVAPVLTANTANSNLKAYASGSQTANTLATATGLGQVTGSGKIYFCGLITKDTTARTIRLKLTIDGTSVFDCTSSSTSISDVGVFAVGRSDSSGTCELTSGIFYNSSFKVEVCSSLTETDKINVLMNYETYS